MRSTPARYPLLPAATFLFLLCAWTFPMSSPAQGVLPTTEQLEIFRGLTPEQREEIMRRLSGGADSGISTRRDRDQTQDRPERERDERELPLPDGGRELEQLEERNPKLTGDDSVIIRVDIARREVPPGELPPGAVVQPKPVTPGNNGQLLPETPPTVTVPVELPPIEKERLEKTIELIRSRNPYQLSADGVLTLPGFPGIELGGLTEFQATLRLQAEPLLHNLDIGVIRLPLKKSGTRALQPFGYDLFNRSPSTFAPVTNVPVPSDYVVGPGDEMDIQLYGNQNRSFTLTVGRDGRINFPELGPVNVSGVTFSSVKTSLEARVQQEMIGVRASVTMGDTRSIRVFVLGEARMPGSYTISGLGTITSALFAAGGVEPIGSLRNVQLKRQGQVIRELDLYDLLIRGDTADDAKLLQGDVVFIPPVGPVVSVEGEVRRPAIYEVKGESTVADVVALAGGMNPEADISKVSLTRIEPDRRRVVVSVDLASATGRAQRVANGDQLRVVRLSPTLASGVRVEGYVHSPANYAYREGLRLSEVIPSVDDLRPNADLHYVLIRRELAPNRQVAVISADLGAALRAPGSNADVVLMPRDRITVFDLESGRDRIIKPLLQELRMQATIVQPSEVVSIGGEVKVAGEYPLEPGMTVSDLIRAGGGLRESAYVGSAELTRYRVVNGDTRRTEQISIDLAAVARGDAAADLPLEAFDNLSIKELPEWNSQGGVTLAGEVRFPGRYSIKRGETLKSVIMRAGGLTDLAFPEGSVFTREDLKRREQEQIDTLSNRLQNDLATLALQGVAANQAQAGSALTVGQSLLSQLRGSRAVGRLVIDLPRAMQGQIGSDADVILRDGDQLRVPDYQQEVTVIGEVQNATSHLFRSDLSREDYLNLSGGVTRRADRDRIYVVRADGSVIASEGARWFNAASVRIRPGDTIVVPLDTERLPSLPFWSAVVQIVTNLAISAAAINSF